MNLERHTLETKRTAQIYTLGNLTPEVTDVWIVLHGIGQLAAYFIKHFEPLVDDSTYVIAPEGLSRYYLNEKYQRVGASWMTKEARLDEIDDHIAYLDKVLDSFIPSLPHPNLRIHLLGFSQGVSTAWRWMLHGKINPDSFVLWAGKAPDEWNDQLKKRLSSIPFYAVAGDQDPFIQPGVWEAEYERLHAVFPQVQVKAFSGKHQIVGEPLVEIWEELRGAFL